MAFGTVVVWPDCFVRDARFVDAACRNGAHDAWFFATARHMSARDRLRVVRDIADKLIALRAQQAALA